MNHLAIILRSGAVALLATYLWLTLPGDLAASSITALLVIAPLYLLAHALRALRLFLVLYDGGLRLRDTLMTHLHAAGVSALIPFKLGELYRLAAVGTLPVPLSRAVIAIWIERVFDALLVAGVLAVLLAVAGPAALAGSEWFIPALGAFLFASILLFLVLPENLVLVKRHLISKHNNAGALSLLKLVDALHQVLADAARIWRTRFATILCLSLGIWALEAGCVVAALAFVGGLDLAEGGARILTTITLRSSPWDLAGPALGAYRLGTVDLLAIAALAIALLAPVGRGRPLPFIRKPLEAVPCA